MEYQRDFSEQWQILVPVRIQVEECRFALKESLIEQLLNELPGIYELDFKIRQMDQTAFCKLIVASIHLTTINLSNKILSHGFRRCPAIDSSFHDDRDAARIHNRAEHGQSICLPIERFGAGQAERRNS